MQGRELTADRVREVVEYKPDTGQFFWKKSTSNRRKAGQLAGCFSNGRPALCIDYKQIIASRLAWFYVHGVWPSGVIDHINGNPSDNRIANLRDVSQSVNLENQRKPRSNNTSGYLGVKPYKRGNKKPWVSQIVVRGKVINLGYFETAIAGHEAYLSAKRKLHIGNTL